VKIILGCGFSINNKPPGYVVEGGFGALKRGTRGRDWCLVGANYAKPKGSGSETRLNSYPIFVTLIPGEKAR